MDHSNMEKALAKAKKELRKQNSRHRQFRQVPINDRDDPTTYKNFLISYPLDYTVRMPFGKATRGMRGWDMEANRMVYVKDYWRAEGGEKEGEIYRSLEENNVPNISRFYCGNDVCRISEICENNVSQEGHETMSQTKTSDWTCPRTGSVRHYRMALDRVGRELTEFRSIHELVTAIADAMQAHDGAYFDANILHRDISSENIMISEDGGFLIDWDKCIRVGPQGQSPKKVERTGTWQFMSVALLQDEEHKHEILDDRESVFHVLTWSALRYTPHSHQDDVEPYLKPYDEVVAHRNGTVTGGTLKKDMIRSPLRVTFYPPALHALIEELCAWFDERYRVLQRRSLIFSGERGGEYFDAIKAHHHKFCEMMRENGSLVRVFRQSLASGDWSNDGVAQENKTRKHKALDLTPDSPRSSKFRKVNDGSRK